MKQLGFGLVETLVSVVIVGILMALAIPAYNDYVANNSLRRVAEEYVAGINNAKFEAIKRNSTVTFNVNGTSWTVVAPAQGAQPATTLASRGGGEGENSIAVNSSGAAITFSGRGLTTAGAQTTINFSNPTVGACQAAGGPVRCLRVTVSPSGQVRLCDPALGNGEPSAC